MDSSCSKKKLKFESVVENSVDKSGKLDWNSVFRHINERELSRKHHCPEEIEEIREVLLDALLTRGCDNEGTVFRFFEFYARYLDVVWWRNSSFFGQFARMDSGRATQWRRTSMPVSSIPWVLKPLTHLRDSFSGRGSLLVPRTPGLEETEWTAMNVCDSKLLGALVKYGYWKGEVERLRNIQKMDFYELWMYLQKHIRQPHGVLLSDQILKGYEIWRKLQEDLEGKPSRGFQRVRLIMRTLKAVALYNEGNPDAEQYVKCLNVYFATMSEPNVSADEVIEFLLFILKEEDCRDAVDQMVDKWVELFGRRPYCSRSLKHLSRCTVRKLLMENKSDVLPGLVDLLPLPRALNDFVLCVPESK